jgi:phospholipid transport system substrate-binding protein
VKIRNLFLLAASVLLIGRAACAVTDDASTQLKSWIDEVIAASNHSKDRETLRINESPILERSINFTIMTRRAVGPGWRQFTPEQQQEATKLFSTLIIRTYVAKITPGEIPSITLKSGNSPSPGHVEVPTSLLYKGSHYDVTYRLEFTDGWHITDVVIEGVSLIANYRTQFEAEFQQGGATAVLKALNHSVESKE